MHDQPEPWKPDPKAEATFARRAGYDPSRPNMFVTSWWWYGLISLQFWWRLAVWVLGARTRAATVWTIFSLITVAALTPLFVIGRRRERGQEGRG